MNERMYLCCICVKLTVTNMVEPFVCFGSTVGFALADAKIKQNNLDGDYWLYEIKDFPAYKPEWAK